METMYNIGILCLVVSLAKMPTCHGSDDLYDLEQRLITALIKVNADASHAVDLLVADGSEDVVSTFAVIPEEDPIGLAVIFPMKVANGSCGMNYLDSRVKLVALPPMGQIDQLQVRCLALNKCDNDYKNFWCIYDLEGQARAEMKFVIEKYINYTEDLGDEVFNGLLNGFDPDFKGLESFSLATGDASEDNDNNLISDFKGLESLSLTKDDGEPPGEVPEEDFKVTKEDINLLLTKANINTIVLVTFFGFFFGALLYKIVVHIMRERSRQRRAELRAEEICNRVRNELARAAEANANFSRVPVCPRLSRCSTSVIIRVPPEEPDAASHLSPDRASPSTYRRLQSPSMGAGTRVSPLDPVGISSGLDDTQSLSSERLDESANVQDSEESNHQKDEALVTNL